MSGQNIYKEKTHTRITHSHTIKFHKKMPLCRTGHKARTRWYRQPSGLTLESSTLSGLTLVSSTLSGLTLVSSTLSGLTLVTSTLSGLTLVSSTLSGLIFQYCNLEDASLVEFMYPGVILGDSGLCCCVPIQCATSIAQTQLLPIVR